MAVIENRCSLLLISLLFVTITINSVVSGQTTETVVTTQPQSTTAAPIIITVSPITPPSGTATAGESYSLECTVTVTGSNDRPTITWLMGPMNNQMMITSVVVTTDGMSTLTFNSLAASDAGTYTCRATLGSAMDSASTTITVQMPNPAVMITSTPVSPIRPIGSTVTLTCTVDLSLLVDVPVSVTAQISGPMGVTITPVTNSVMENATRYTSTATVSPFGREHSGEYTCMATVRLVTENLFIIGGTGVFRMDRITTGVYLSLRGVVIYANNSVIQITEIGETNPDTDLNDGLQCITDRMPCCRTAFRTGEWYFPDMTMVPGPSLDVRFYRNRGYDDGTVNLNRKYGVMMPTGLFCCEVPDAASTSIMHRLCASIFRVNIRPTGSTTAGGMLTLICSIEGLKLQNINNFIWKRSDGSTLADSDLRQIQSSNPFKRSLMFDPLFTSHGGNYTCEISAGGRNTSVVIQLPSISSTAIRIESTHTSVVLVGDSPPINITLTCIIELPASVDTPVDVNIEWTRPSGVKFLPRNHTTSVNFGRSSSRLVRLSSLIMAARSGNYTCQTTVTSPLEFITGSALASQVYQIVSVPVNMTLSQQPTGHLHIGNSLRLSCTITIAIQVPLLNSSNINVCISWTKMGQSSSESIGMFNTSSEVTESGGLYTYLSTLMITSLTFADSASYTCAATISPYSNSSNLFNSTEQSATISIQLIPSSPNIIEMNITSTNVSISWMQDPQDTYDNFTISYTYNGPCNINEINRTINVTAQRNEYQHTITDLRIFSNYTLIVYAVNSAGRSLPTSSSTVNLKTRPDVPYGQPQSLRVESSNFTSIHILWDPVNCTERNSEIVGYSISYYPSGHSRYMKSDNIFLTSAMERRYYYVATQLTPLINYTFMVTAVSSYNGSSFSLPAIVAHQTNRTSEVIFFLNGMIHVNNSIINVSDIGSTNYEALLCLTTASNCCGNNHDNQGEWYLPSGVPVNANNRMHFYRNRGPSVLRLKSTMNDDVYPDVGMYRCEIPDDGGFNQTVYIGIYPSGIGMPIINKSPEYSSYNNRQILTCTSAGGPATTVEWSKDGKILGDEYEQLKRIINLTTAEYQTTLTLGQSRPEEVIGNYTCRVNNARSKDTKTIRLHGIQITEIEKGVPLGKRLSLNCTTDLASTNISWLDSDGEVLETSSTQQLTLVISEITDAHHNKTYTCQVIGPFGDQNKAITLLVAQLSMADSSSTIGGVVAALLLLLLLMVGISVTIVIFIVKRSKNKTFRPFHKPVQYKPQKELGDDDYTPAPTTGTKGESIEMKQNEEEKEKDYYFMDTSLLAGEHVKPILVSEVSGHVERLHADRDKLFEMEYESMSKHPQSSHTIADIPHNKCKNRFANIFPYDSSRVKLKEISGEDGSDYINASHLDGYNKPKAYIGAQGPMPNTVTDFWRMIWEKKLPTVVMLTRCFEGRKKCEEYWPLNVGESVQPGHGLTITLNSTLPFAEYSLRKMTLTSSTAPGSAPLKVTQYHFTGWPDHGVPQNGVTLINFIRRVRTSHPYSDSRPLLVHCSAGVGRTGAFIVLDSMLQRMQVEQNLNIYEFLKQLRSQRVLMVQTQAQYNFIHDALNELILCGDTEITAPNLRIVISRLNKTTDGETGYTKQFNLIAQMSPGYSESDYTQANMECNLSKNRYPNILPNDHFRVMLRAATATGSDYINASFVDGYRQRGGYIATQAPMENTVNDFWRMVWDYQSRAIVMLCRMKEDGKEACCPFLPEHKGDSEVYGKIRVKLVSKETTTDYVIQQLEVSEDKPHPQGYASSETVVKVGVFHYIRWPKHGTPRGTAALLDLIQHINKTQMTSGNKPITVMCNDGVGRTGTFICIHAQLERLKTEGVVDFFQSIKSARIQRAGFVPDVHQYILCHNLVADYLDGFDTYANFKELV